MDSSGGMILLNCGASTDGATLPKNTETAADQGEARQDNYMV
jgi:hypothetical protein